MGAGGSSTGSDAKAKGKLTVWGTAVEVSGPAQKECTVDAVLELKHMIHVHTTYQQRTVMYLRASTYKAASSTPSWWDSAAITAEIQEVKCAEEQARQSLLLKPPNSVRSSSTVLNLSSLSHHC